MTLTTINGRWTLDLPDHRARLPHWPWWEAERLAATHHLITGIIADKGSCVVWEIGAEEGDFPALYASWGASVVIVEPNPRVWPNIAWIWRRNGLDGPAGWFGLDGPAGWFVGLASDVTELAPPAPRPGVPHQPVGTYGWPTCADGPVIADHGFVSLTDGRPTIPQARIDDLALWLPAPDVITMDIEGGEVHAIPGGQHTLTTHRPIVVASLHPQFAGDAAIGNLLRGMRDLFGYTTRHLCTDHEEHWVFTPTEQADRWPGLV